MKLNLSRFESTDMGTFGILSSEGEIFKCFTTELPWRNNERQKSHIPSGIYQCSWIRSPKFGWVYGVQQVPERSNILFHSGNYAGDVDMGWKSNSYGCILPASGIGYFGKQKVGTLSSSAVRGMNSFLNKEPFLLEIRDDYLTKSSE